MDDFVNLRLECLIEIIQQDELEVEDEIDVFNAVYRLESILHRVLGFENYWIWE